MASAPIISAPSSPATLPSASNPLPAHAAHPGVACLMAEGVRRLSWLALEDPANWPQGVVRGQIAEAQTLLAAALKPAQGEAIAVWVEFLMSRYRARPDQPHFADMDKRMWLRALQAWPEDVLEAAVTLWCLEDRPFAPAVPGELKALGEPILTARLALLYRVERMLRAPAEPPGGVSYVDAAKLAALAPAPAAPAARSGPIAERFAAAVAGQGRSEEGP